MPIHECTYKTEPRKSEKKLSAKDRLSSRKVVNLGFDQKTGLAEAKRCLGENICESCDLCVLVCPDMCITRNEAEHKIDIDYKICSGCGVCAFMCPRGAIKMVAEIA